MDASQILPAIWAGYQLCTISSSTQISGAQDGSGELRSQEKDDMWVYANRLPLG